MTFSPKLAVALAVVALVGAIALIASVVLTVHA